MGFRIEEYKKYVYRDKYVEFDDAWYDDGLVYVESLVAKFNKNDWLELNKEIKSFNDATNLKVAESLSDIYLLDSIYILIELLTLVQPIQILEEISTILYFLLKENSGIEIVFTKEKCNSLKKLEKKSFILSKYIGGVVNQYCIG